MKTRRFRWLVVVISVVLLSLSLQPVQAQAFQPIIRFGGVSNLSWSADGLLSFQEGKSSLYATPDHPWYTYYPNTQQLATSDVWPRQPVLTEDELAYFRPVKDIFGGYNPEKANRVNTFIFSSPNGRYLVFPSEAGTNRHSMWIADRQTREMAELYFYVLTLGNGLYDFNVIWNRPGTMFIVTSSGDGYGGSTEIANMEAVVTNFTEDINDVKVMDPWDMNLTIDGEWHIAAELYGISDDGLHVLLNVYDPDRAYQLMRWDAVLNTAILVGDFDGEEVATAMFEDGDPDRIVVFSDRGISRYTISNGYHQILTDQIRAEWPPSAVFSNDGRWLAVDRFSRGLYVFDLDNDFMGLKAQAYSDPTSRFGDSEIIFPHLKVVNTGDWPLDLSKIILRYYFKPGDDQPLNAVCWAGLIEGSCRNVMVTIGGPEDEYSSYRYLDVGFKAGVLPAHNETDEVIVRINKQDWSGFDYIGTSGILANQTDTFVDQPDIPIFYDGKMVWGHQPW